MQVAASLAGVADSKWFSNPRLKHPVTSGGSRTSRKRHLQPKLYSQHPNLRLPSQVTRLVAAFLTAVLQVIGFVGILGG